MLYVDGVRLGSTGSFNPTGVVVNPTWLVGARYESGGSRAPGVYDNTAVYDNALTAFEVHQLYNISVDGVTLGNGPALPAEPGLRHLYTSGPASHPQPNVELDSTSGYDGLVNAGTWVADNPPQNEGGWQKTANGDHVRIPIQANVREGTFEGWFKTDSSTGNWQNPLATSIRAIGETGWADSMRIEVTSTDTFIFDAPGSGTVSTGVDTTDGLWHYLALTYEDGQPVKLYIDGVLEGQSSGNYNASLAYDRGFTMLGSRDIGGTEGWRGTVGTFGYHNIALHEGAILNHFQTGNFAHIPEPASVLLLILGGVGLASVGWRRRRRA